MQNSVLHFIYVIISLFHIHNVTVVLKTLHSDISSYSTRNQTLQHYTYINKFQAMPLQCFINEGYAYLKLEQFSAWEPIMFVWLIIN